MATNTELLAEVNDLKAQLDAITAQVTKTRQDLEKAKADQAWYEGQYPQYIANKDFDGARRTEQYINVQKAAVASLTAGLASQTATQASVQAAYNKAVAGLNDLQKQVVQTNNQVAVTDAQKSLTDAKTALVTQGTTKYLIYGAIALVVVVIFGIVMYKRSA